MSEMSAREQRALALFGEGYSCAQAGMGAFADDLPLERSALLRMTSSMGAVMGRLREVCGAVTSMLLIDGLRHGPDSPDPDRKAAQYARVQALCKRFEAQFGSIICRELLGRAGAEPPTPEKRDSHYYSSRPCARLVAGAVRILEENWEESK